MLSGTTVSEISDLLKNNQNLDGKSVTDWFVSDFSRNKQLTKQAFAERPNTTINMQ
jgi:hypothetical protein